KPLAWWTFEEGEAVDRMGTFAPGRLVGKAKVAGGRLHLAGGYMAIGVEPPRDRSSEPWPTYHIAALPDEGVCRPYDTNGCIHLKGRYHLMYIFQHRQRGHSWGHMSSKDLVNWTYHPAALVPQPGDPDRGIFSGNAFVNRDGAAMLCWFGVGAGVCVATAEDDELIRWKKHPKNPIIPIPKQGEPGHGVYKVWDPYLWLEGDTYYCLLGGNTLKNGKDTLYLCRSSDLVNWTPLHPFYEHPDLSWTTAGEDCSCPDFFRLGDRHVLMCISHKVGGRFYVGRFDRAKEKFLPERHVRMNWPGGNFFAPESLLGPDGRRIFWAWVTDPRFMATQRSTGSGVMSTPRVLSLEPDGSPRIVPAAELETLRRNPRTIPPASLAADGETTLDGVRGDTLELAVEIDPGQARRVGLKVRCSPDGREETGIWYDPAAKKLTVDMSRSTLRTDVAYGQSPLGTGRRPTPTSKHPKPTVEAPLELGPGETLKLRVFLDRPMLEVFANDRQCITQQIFPDGKDSLLVKACAEGGQAKLLGGQAWDVAPAKFVDRRQVEGPGGPGHADAEHWIRFDNFRITKMEE
ncbi:MAG: glycoside hydrolase family 32 protein, partial [Phycisphaerae bacterium]